MIVFYKKTENRIVQYKIIDHISNLFIDVDFEIVIGYVNKEVLYFYIDMDDFLVRNVGLNYESIF